MNTLLPGNPDTELMAKELFQRAALNFEQADLKHDAALCLIEAGDLGKAAQLFLDRDEFIRAAPLLLANKQYATALQCYEKWLDSLLESDLESQVTARFGIAACLVSMETEKPRAKEMYKTARSLFEYKENLHPAAARHCWEALANYGIYTGRLDLAQLGFERAIASDKDQSQNERSRIIKSYLDAAKSNNLLQKELEGKIEILNIG